MAVTIRLSKVGRKNATYYRVVVADQRFKRDGRILESVGSYNPREAEEKVVLKKERIQYWMTKGARPTPTVNKLIKTAAKVKAAA